MDYSKVIIGLFIMIVVIIAVAAISYIKKARSISVGDKNYSELMTQVRDELRSNQEK